jgi:two-component system, OmpR family, phosphate regulon sensor histidine kinase PhoR
MDKEHAVELIKNLVENGVRYNNAGGFVKVNIIDDKKSTKLIVEDNGIGIEEEHQARIFERFYRVNKSRSRETGGTGLGLAIVKHICLLYKADIELKSKYGVGTTITVTFNK